MRYVTLYLIFFLFSSKLFALDCTKDKFENINLTICKASISTDDVRLYLQTKDGEPFGNFNTLRQELNKNGKELARIIGSIDFNEKKFVDWLKVYN